MVDQKEGVYSIADTIREKKVTKAGIKFLKIDSFVLILFAFLILLSSGCDLISGYQKEEEEEKQAFGPVEEYNPRIKEAQNCLKRAGFAPGSIDGRMGWKTREAIKDFQRANKLKVSGFIDSKTWAKLNIHQQLKETPKEASTSKKEKDIILDDEIQARLKSSYWVKKIQVALKNAGFDPGPIDGKIGKKTKSAIRNFQKSVGLIPDGTINSKTWEKMSRYFPK